MDGSEILKDWKHFFKGWMVFKLTSASDKSLKCFVKTINLDRRPLYRFTLFTFFVSCRFNYISRLQSGPADLITKACLSNGFNRA